jgi:hypothetical protein
MTALELGKGPLVGRLVEQQIHWLIQHPQGTADECLQYMQQALPALQQAQTDRNNAHSSSSSSSGKS